MTNHRDWYLEYKKNPQADVRLFCFHHSGGAASFYFPWVESLSSNIELLAIQLPGRENRFSEPLMNDLKDILNSLTEAFHVYKDKPFFTFGHSLGALIAFEFALSIRNHYAVSPCHMIISSTKAPHLPFRMKPLSNLDHNTLKKELEIYNGIDERIRQNDELLNLFLPIIKSDFSIYESHHYAKSEPFSCDILAISGGDDKTVTTEEILAWSDYTMGKFKHLSFPGGHFYLKEHQKQIIEIINQIGNQYI